MLEDTVDDALPLSPSSDNLILIFFRFYLKPKNCIIYEILCMIKFGLQFAINSTSTRQLMSSLIYFNLQIEFKQQLHRAARGRCMTRVAVLSAHFWVCYACIIGKLYRQSLARSMYRSLL